MLNQTLFLGKKNRFCRNNNMYCSWVYPFIYQPLTIHTFPTYPLLKNILVLCNFNSGHFFFFDTESPRHAPRGYSGPAGGADKSSVEMLPRQSGLCGQSAGNYRGHFQQAESGPVC